MKFEWDESKNKINIKKHGISFEEAKDIFNSSFLTYFDKRHDYEEVREISIGEIKGLIVIVVVHTDRKEKIRIISARKANKKERSRYYGHIPKKT